MTKYKNCTEYWLDSQNGTLRGEFEEMYRDIKDPWGCETGKSSLNNRIFVDIVFDGNRHFDRILDIGCGLGGLLDTIRTRNGAGGGGMYWAGCFADCNSKSKGTLSGPEF